MDINRKKHLASSFAVFAVSVAALIIGSDQAHAEKPTPVSVVSPVPLPVTGSVNGSVSISGTPNVFVTNTDGNPLPTRDVDNPARTPIQFKLCQTSSFGGGNPGVTCTDHSFQVSSEYRLVIEYISGQCFFTPAVVTSIQLAVSTRVGGSSASHNLHLLSNALDQRDLDIGQQVRIYADPDTSVGLSFGASAGPGTGSISCDVTLSGYRVTP